MLSALDTPPQGDFEDIFLLGFVIVIALVAMIFFACHPQQQIVKPTTKDTTGHWEYTHDEEMEWRPDSTTSKAKP